MGTRSPGGGEPRCARQPRGRHRARDEPQARDDAEATSYLRIWQVQQLGRSYIDNLMNRALEDAQGGGLAGEGGVEDTAVLAAIRDHGLKLPRRRPPPPPLEHSSFMDAAVMAAIQRKGLSSLSASDV
ncbi:uncharacterized protein LOC134530948 [Bacillus rossius redtenbacheri]|uniref:uncharacterized protein LOC134530948 n=1 Tax=Bacillus rossius redtenbacheri TaxID=93214 RepID=UPI002FDDB256